MSYLPASENAILSAAGLLIFYHKFSKMPTQSFRNYFMLNSFQDTTTAEL